MMPKFLCRMYEVVEYQFKVDAKDEDEAWDNAHEQLNTYDGDPVNYHACNFEFPNEIEEFAAQLQTQKTTPVQQKPVGLSAPPRS